LPKQVIYYLLSVIIILYFALSIKQKQMKSLVTLTFLLFTSIACFANPVGDSTAKVVASNFLISRVNSKTLSAGSDLKLVYTAKNSGITCFYVFNVVSTKGFVMVSADDAAKPILGYSDESDFDTTHIPIQVSEWFGGYTKQLTYIISNKLEATDAIKNNWQELKVPGLRTKYKLFGTGTPPFVGPLLQTKWDQSPNWLTTGQYNALCPYDSINNDRTVTGCTATAMAQVMKYWNYPNKGVGFNLYTPTSNPYLGLQSANFGNTIYKWSSMPLTLSSSSSTTQTNAVATLMYHCGVSVNMDYGVASVGGSGAPVVGNGNTSEFAFKNYFGYDSSLIGILRKKYTSSQWLSLIKNEFDAKRPVIYVGFGKGGGHCFVADGYDNNNYLHFNWGWSGIYNGYFEIDSLNPEGVGTGGGDGGYNSGQQAIIGIKPTTSKVINDIRLYANVSPADTTIYYGDSIIVTTNIANRSTTTFSGDYCAALFDTASKFVDYIQTISSKTLKPNSHYLNPLIFSTNQRFNIVPGKYKVEIFYRPTGGNWLPVSDTLGYVNSTSLTIVGDIFDSLVLFAPLKTTPTLLTQGQPDTFSFNVVNRASTAFTGQFAAALYNLDGSFGQLIGRRTVTNPLKTGFHYTNPVTFISSSITVQPGTYLLLVEDSVTNGYWRLTGCGKYTNPIVVSVQAPVQFPDRYEQNDSISKSYLLPITFTNNFGYGSTAGSNINVGTDNDFYKIKLPKGYNYTISPVLNNQSYSRTDSLYSANAIFSMSYDSINWTGTYQDTLQQPITAKGGQTIYFHVAPYFQGQKGTYLLEINVTRTAITPVSLSNIHAVQQNKDIAINWHTSTELNTANFIIQHSTDGSSFTTIGNVKAIGNGANEYSFTDTHPTVGTNYYRLESVDKDGASTFSKVVSAEIVDNRYEIVVVPNPVKSVATIKGNHIALVQVIDNIGRVVKTVSLKDATNPTLSVSGLPTGVYHLRVQTTDGKASSVGLVKE